MIHLLVYEIWNLFLLLPLLCHLGTSCEIKRYQWLAKTPVASQSKKVDELLLFFPVKQSPSFEIYSYFICNVAVYYINNGKGVPCKHILQFTHEDMRLSHFDSHCSWSQMETFWTALVFWKLWNSHSRSWLKPFPLRYPTLNVSSAACVSCHRQVRPTGGHGGII